jgi:hypothetical protein
MKLNPRQLLLLDERVGRARRKHKGRHGAFAPDEFEGAELRQLMAVLVRSIDTAWAASAQPAARTKAAREMKFSEVAGLAHDAGLFPWLGGRWTGEGAARKFVLSQHGKSQLGLLLRHAARVGVWNLPDGRPAQLTHRGRNRHRRYRIALADASNESTPSPSRCFLGSLSTPSPSRCFLGSLSTTTRGGWCSEAVCV